MKQAYISYDKSWFIEYRLDDKRQGDGNFADFQDAMSAVHTWLVFGEMTQGLFYVT